MSAFRRRLRWSVTAWLVFQVVSLSALVPVDCCDAHRARAESRAAECHESAPAAMCPMRAADGTACPMHPQEAEPPEADLHAAHAAHAAHEQSPRPADCALRGSCKGPMAALFTLLSQHGVLHDPTSPVPTFEATAAPAPARENVVCRLEAPDAPPPRS